MYRQWGYTDCPSPSATSDVVPHPGNVEYCGKCDYTLLIKTGLKGWIGGLIVVGGSDGCHNVPLKLFKSYSLNFGQVDLVTLVVVFCWIMDLDLSRFPVIDLLNVLLLIMAIYP